jgi:DNA-binding NarL/FixJ family response regulator
VRQLSVAIVDEHDVFRRGIEACLRDDPSISVIASVRSGHVPTESDVAVTSPSAAVRSTTACPVVVCVGDNEAATAEPLPSNVVARLARNTLTPEQLIGAVRAAAAGLRINIPETPEHVDERGRAVLRLLAEGASTREISSELGYSERTIKSEIHRVAHELGARSRAQAVAEAIRAGII